MKTDSFAYHVTRYFSDYLPNQTAASPNTIHSYRDTFVQLLNFFKKKHVLRKNSGFLILHLKMWKNFCAGLKRKGESAPLQETSGLLQYMLFSGTSSTGSPPDLSSVQECLLSLSKKHRLHLLII